jgi:hypothetical protein
VPAAANEAENGEEAYCDEYYDDEYYDEDSDDDEGDFSFGMRNKDDCLVATGRTYQPTDTIVAQKLNNRHATKLFISVHLQAYSLATHARTHARTHATGYIWRICTAASTCAECPIRCRPSSRRPTRRMPPKGIFFDPTIRLLINIII